MHKWNVAGINVIKRVTSRHVFNLWRLQYCSVELQTISYHPITWTVFDFVSFLFSPRPSPLSESVDTYKEVTKKETFIEVKSSSYTSSEIKSSFSSSEIKSTRLDDILKSVTTSPEPPRRNGKNAAEPPPPPPPARTESRDIKQILATHRSRPRRPLNDPGRHQNGKLLLRGDNYFVFAILELSRFDN